MDDFPRLSRRALLRTATLLAAAPLLEACRPPPPPPQPNAPATSPAENPPTLAPPTLAPTSAPAVEIRPESTSPPTVQPRRGGLITVSISSEPTLNPFTWPGQFATQLVARPLWNGLTRYEPGTMRVVPDLATSWAPAPDGLSW